MQMQARRLHRFGARCDRSHLVDKLLSEDQGEVKTPSTVRFISIVITCSRRHGWLHPDSRQIGLVRLATATTAALGPGSKCLKHQRSAPDAPSRRWPADRLFPIPAPGSSPRPSEVSGPTIRGSLALELPAGVDACRRRAYP